MALQMLEVFNVGLISFEQIVYQCSKYTGWNGYSHLVDTSSNHPRSLTLLQTKIVIFVHCAPMKSIRRNLKQELQSGFDAIISNAEKEEKRKSKILSNHARLKFTKTIFERICVCFRCFKLRLVVCICFSVFHLTKGEGLRSHCFKCHWFAKFCKSVKNWGNAKLRVAFKKLFVNIECYDIFERFFMLLMHCYHASAQTKRKVSVATFIDNNLDKFDEIITEMEIVLQYIDIAIDSHHDFEYFMDKLVYQKKAIKVRNNTISLGNKIKKNGYGLIDYLVNSGCVAVSPDKLKKDKNLSKIYKQMENDNYASNWPRTKTSKDGNHYISCKNYDDYLVCYSSDSESVKCAFSFFVCNMI